MKQLQDWKEKLLLKICRYDFILWLKSNTSVAVRGGSGSLSLDQLCWLEFYSVNTPHADLPCYILQSLSNIEDTASKATCSPAWSEGWLLWSFCGYELVGKAVARMRCTHFHGNHLFEGVDSEAEGGHQEKVWCPLRGAHSSTDIPAWEKRAVKGKSMISCRESSC